MNGRRTHVCNWLPRGKAQFPSGSTISLPGGRKSLFCPAALTGQSHVASSCGPLGETIIFLFLKAHHLNATINPQQTRLRCNTFPKPTHIFDSQLHKLRQHSRSHLGGAAGSVLQLARCLRFFSEGRASCSGGGGGGGPLCGSSRLTASWPRCGMPRSPWE